VLFLTQGRAAENAALGATVEHAVRVGLDAGVSDDLDAEFATVPPFTLPQRIFIRPVPGLEDGLYRALRWHLARGWAARRLIRRHRSDVIHVTTDQVSFLLGGVQRRTPCVLSLDITTYDWLRLLRGLPADAPMPRDLQPLVALERRALHRAPLSIPWTETVAAQARAIAPRARVEALHPGVDLERFRPAAGRRGDGPLKVLFVGGRWEAKGGPDLVAALSDDLGTTAELHVVSPVAPPAVPGMTVHSAGPGSPELLARFHEADVLCLPSYVDATPWVVVEALATGLPVVASDIGSIPELVGPEAGRLVAPGDVAGLRAALRELRDDDLRARMGEAGRTRAEERFDARRNTRRLAGLLREVA
jgi:glycosyltransferase involved in cell wall biosynthesis